MRSYGDYLERFFPGEKVQKISIDAGFTCPNRDGKVGKGGCIYCRNDSFSPGYCNSRISVSEQIKKGKEFFGRKYPAMKYLAYFQSFTGTYGMSLSVLEGLYREAIGERDIVGLVVSTRPDCISEDIVSLFQALNEEKLVFIEIGAETCHNKTLGLINRNHTWEEVEKAVTIVKNAGLQCGLHLIAGLPGETENDIIETIKRSVTLPIDTIKLHQLQILKDTTLADLWQKGELNVKEYSLEEYLVLCKKIYKIVPENIVIERFISQSPPHMVISPKWGLKNYEFMNKLAAII